MLHARHVDATDEQVGHLVTFTGRDELPIDRHLYDTVDPARDDDPFLIGLAAQYREAFTIDMAKECRIHNDDVILVTTPPPARRSSSPKRASRRQSWCRISRPGKNAGLGRTCSESPTLPMISTAPAARAAKVFRVGSV